MSGIHVQFLNHTEPCGSELARDSGMTDNINSECDGPIASKLAPTGGCVLPDETCRNNKAARKRLCWSGSHLNAVRPACVPGSGC
ncbi:hypothetical protein C9I50_20505 [Pseudomonas prosekii]|nr:hypothetical protein C9I50_20505 [Pseudomonas prosekii]